MKRPSRSAISATTHTHSPLLQLFTYYTKLLPLVAFRRILLWGTLLLRAGLGSPGDTVGRLTGCCALLRTAETLRSWVLLSGERSKSADLLGGDKGIPSGCPREEVGRGGREWYGWEWGPDRLLQEAGWEWRKDWTGWRVSRVEVLSWTLLETKGSNSSSWGEPKTIKSSSWHRTTKG